MRKILLMASIACIAFAGCKKDKKTLPEDENSDLTNRVFRVITRADVKYQVSILEINNIGQIDTLQNVYSNSPSYFNYGFTPKIGSHILISSTAPNAGSLDCTITYEGVRLGLDTVKNSNNSLHVNFEYVIKK